MKISYIIVTYKSELLIKECIKSIQELNTHNEFEIIVVDNSPIEQQKLIETICNSFSDPVMYIPNENLGYGQGNNVGIKNASGNIISIVNPDVRFTEPFVDVVLTNFSNDKKLALVGLKQIGGYDLSFYLKPEYYFPIFNSVIIKVFNKLNIFTSKFFFLSGACFFISKEKFFEIGLFDEKLFMYYEESDINTRLTSMNYKIKYIKKIKYLHLIGNRESLSIPLFIHELKSLEHYMTKYGFNLKINFFLKRIEYFLTSKLKYQLLNEYIKSQGNKI